MRGPRRSEDEPTCYSTSVTTTDPGRSASGAVVTAFHPPSELVARVEALFAQVDAVVVVDDTGVGAGPEPQVLNALRQVGAHIIRHPENRGIGAALNSGIEALGSLLGQEWGFLLTVDQDSTLPDGYVDALRRAHRAAIADGVAVGMISPEIVTSITRITPRPSQAAYAVGGEPIQSGLGIPTEVLRSLGGFRDDLFIDGIDTDFYLRAKAAGLQSIVVPGLALEHRLGRAHEVRLPGRTLDLVVAQDFRYYYLFRNLVHLVRAHRREAPAWSAWSIARQLRHLSLVTVMVPGRRPRLREAAAGARDGIRGTTGRRPDPCTPRPKSGIAPTVHTAGPRVSVCMATWNGEEFVEEQLASILPQLGPQDEIVVVDDASTDATADVIDDMQDPRIRVIRLENNGGYVRAFARALAEARGTYLLLADQDDVWLPGRLEVMVDALGSADVVAGNLATLGGPKGIRGPFGQSDWRLSSRTSGHRVRNILGILGGNMPYYGCAMGVRSDARAQGILPFPAFLRESHDLWIALYGNIAGSMVHCDDRVLARRYHESNQTPNRPRGPAAVLRSRLMLMRCIGVILARRLRRSKGR